MAAMMLHMIPDCFDDGPLLTNDPYIPPGNRYPPGVSQGGRLALGPLASLRTRNGPSFGSLFFRRNWPLWVVWGCEISTRDPNFEPLSWFGHPFFLR